MDILIARKGILNRDIFRDLFLPDRAVADRTFAAGVETVKACHAAAVIDLVLFHVYAGRLALSTAQSAVPAFLRIDDRLENGKT